MYPYDPLSYTGARQLLAGPTIPGRSGASGQTKHSPVTSLDHGAREENGLRPLRKTCGHSGLGKSPTQLLLKSITETETMNTQPHLAKQAVLEGCV